MKRNVAGQTIDGQIFLLADGLPFTGVASVSVKKDNGVLTVGLGPTPVHAGQGNHGYSPTKTETDGERVSYVFSGTGAATITVQVYTTFPQTVDNNVLASGVSGFVAIKTKTDGIDIKTTNLPPDPADESLLITATDALNIGIVGIQTDLDNAIDGLGAIKTGVDAIDTAPMRGTDSANLLNPLSAIQVKSEIDTALTDIGLDHLINAPVVGTDIVDNSIIASMVSKSVIANWDDFENTADSLQALEGHINGIASTGTAFHSAVSSYVIEPGGGVQSFGTFTNTEFRNSISHEHTDTAGKIDIYYEFDIGLTGKAVEVEWTALINGPNDDINIYAWDWSGGVWNLIGSLTGTNGSTFSTTIEALFGKHTGTGGNIGKVRIKFLQPSGLTSATLKIDQLFIGYAEAISSEIAKIPKSDLAVTWNATALASMNTQADLALTDYDPPTRIETISDKTELITSLDDIKGTGFIKNTNSLVDGIPLGAGAIGSTQLAIGAVNDIADGINQRPMTETYAGNGVVPTQEQMLHMIWSALSQFAVGGQIISCKRLNGVTQSMTFTLDSATIPTLRNRTT